MSEVHSVKASMKSAMYDVFLTKVNGTEGMV
jgi:hypothetical protein